MADAVFGDEAVDDVEDGVAVGATTYTYDATGNATVVTSPQGTLAYTYDAAGRRASMSTPAGSLTYAYDPSGNLTAITDPQGHVATFAFSRPTHAVTTPSSVDTVRSATDAPTTEGAGDRIGHPSRRGYDNSSNVARAPARPVREFLAPQGAGGDDCDLQIHTFDGDVIRIFYPG